MTDRHKALTELRDAVARDAPLMEFMTLASALADTHEEYANIMDAYHSKSVDAAIDLFNAVLPGWAYEIWGGADDAEASVYPPIVAGPEHERTQGVDIFRVEADGEAPARALLLATLDALIAQETRT